MTADNARLLSYDNLCEALSAEVVEVRSTDRAEGSGVGSAARSAASLVLVTQLGERGRNPVTVTLWPECGEATVVYLGGGAGQEFPAESGVASSLGLTQLADQLREEERRTESQRVRTSRARGRIRRYVVRNLLTRMWTLTFADQPHDRGVALERMQTFVRALRDHFGEAIPYLYVFERHKSGAWHVHLLTQSRYVKHKTLERLWGYGFVQYSDGPKRHGRSKREVARSCARYAAKYVGKDIGGGLPANVHAYEPAQGFQPERVARSAASMQDGFGLAVHEFDGLVPVVWNSAECDTWTGPPVMCLRWDEDGA